MGKGFVASVLGQTANAFTGQIKSFDMYPKTISFTFNGEEEFKTLIGGTVSLVIKVVIIMYSYLMLRIMIDRKDTQKSVNTIVTDILNDNNPVFINVSDFQFAVQISVEGDSEFDIRNNEYAAIELFQWTKNTTTGELQSTEIKMEECGDSLFKYHNQTEVKFLDIDGYLCPSTRDFYVQGNSLSEEFLFIEMNVGKCRRDSPPCPDDLDEFMSKLRIKIPFVNTYFDFDDYNDPVKTYIDGRFDHGIMNGFMVAHDVFLQKNDAELQDNYFAYQPGGNEKEFVGVDRVDQKLAIQDESTDNIVYKIQFVKDAASKSYERSVFSFMEVTGNIGGLFEILSIAGGFIVGAFSGRMFLFSILSKLYQVDSPAKNTFNLGDENLNVESFEEIQHKEEQRGFEGSNQAESRHHISNKAHRRMKKRVRYDWKLSDFVFNLFSSLKCLCFCCCRMKNKLHIKLRHKLYERGEEKFIKEFDAVTFARNARNMNTLINSMMDEKERMMVIYQKSNVIPLNSDTKSSESEDPYDEVPKMFSLHKKKILHQHMVNKFMSEYSLETWSGRDFRLLNGVYSKHKLKENLLHKLCRNGKGDESFQKLGKSKHVIINACDVEPESNYQLQSLEESKRAVSESTSKAMGPVPYLKTIKTEI
ncbi:unnamed protein product [Moneuplotes crassus]|uniref:Uncharacterized protein n=2 Tax=Euplotes crassus TaxID=5936 RepID=A0AAD1XZ72_EUPCR|nr:unnamed protein product [Moneuplotes crassus]